MTVDMETDPLAPLIVKWLLHDFASPIATMLTASELLGDRADRELNSIVTGSARRAGGAAAAGARRAGAG